MGTALLMADRGALMAGNSLEVSSMETNMRRKGLHALTISAVESCFIFSRRRRAPSM